MFYLGVSGINKSSMIHILLTMPFTNNTSHSMQVYGAIINIIQNLLNQDNAVHLSQWDLNI